MNTIISIDWGRYTIAVTFTDYNTAHYFSFGNAVTIKGAKSRMRRELRRKTGAELSYLKYWKSDGSVDYYQAKRVEN